MPLIFTKGQKKAGTQKTLDKLCSMKHSMTFSLALTGYFVDQFFFKQTMVVELSPYLKEQKKVELNFN